MTKKKARQVTAEEVTQPRSEAAPPKRGGDTPLANALAAAREKPSPNAACISGCTERMRTAETVRIVVDRALARFVRGELDLVRLEQRRQPMELEVDRLCVEFAARGSPAPERRGGILQSLADTAPTLLNYLALRLSRKHRVTDWDPWNWPRR